jgi:hypothetical protein
MNAKLMAATDIDYKKETDEACKLVDDKYRPVFEEYKKDIAEVTEKEILNQLNKQIIK